MTDRIHLILKTKNISASKFADEIGVQRSSISHILSGRNNPSLELVQKILKRFPDINIEWIISGKGSMYISPDLFSNEPEADKSINQVQSEVLKESDEVNNKQKITENIEETDDMSYFSEPELFDQKLENTKIESIPEKAVPVKEIKPTEEEYKNIEPISPQNKQKTIERIVIFYSDKSFEDYRT